MIEIIEGLPAGAFGVETKGKLSPDDYEKVLIPAIEREFEKHDKLSLAIVIGDEFKGVEAGALWDDAKLGMSHLFAWSKIAIITDHDWYKHIAGVSAFLTHAEVKVFELDERDEAMAWVSEGL
jgi:hypothetical protein